MPAALGDAAGRSGSGQQWGGVVRGQSFRLTLMYSEGDLCPAM